MTMEVHDICKHDMDCFIKECACFFHDRQSKNNLSFCIQFFKQHVVIVFCSLCDGSSQQFLLDFIVIYLSQVSTQAEISTFKNPHTKIDLLPRDQNPLSYYTL
jgi:hypothetical protein